MRFKKPYVLLAGPLVVGAIALLPMGSAAQVQPDQVPAGLEAAIEAEIESRGETYAGLCEAIEQSEHVGEWCAFVLSLSETEAEVTFGAVLSDELEEATFVQSGGDWTPQSETPKTATPTPTTTTSQSTPTTTTSPSTPSSTSPPATATPRANSIQVPNTGSAGLR